MPAEAQHHTVGTLPIAVGLGATAGFVDAFIYQRVAPVFVANMSGNLIRLGIAGGSHERAAVVTSLVALAGFMAGVIAGAVQIDSRVRRGERASPAGLLVVESGLLVSLPIILALSGLSFSTDVHLADYPVIAIGAVAMGVQAVALRRVGQVAVSTTYGTGAVVRLAEKLALAARRAPRPADHARRISIAVLSVVLVSYVAGAFLAASLNANHWLLLAPSLMPLVSAVGLRKTVRDDAGDPVPTRSDSAGPGRDVEDLGL